MGSFCHEYPSLRARFRLLAVLTAHGQSATHVPGGTVNQMSTAYAREAKTDARDAYVIAETVRHRGELTPVDVPRRW